MQCAQLRSVCWCVARRGSGIAELATTGWTLVEQLDCAEIQRRYFAKRTDGYRAFPLMHLACARVV
jgi:hypothetical protein